MTEGVPSLNNSCPKGADTKIIRPLLQYVAFYICPVLVLFRALPIFNFYGYFRIFYGYIDFFFILKMDLNGFNVYSLLVYDLLELAPMINLLADFHIHRIFSIQSDLSHGIGTFNNFCEPRTCEGKYSKVWASDMKWLSGWILHGELTWSGPYKMTQKSLKTTWTNTDLRKLGEHYKSYLSKIMILTPSTVISYTQSFDCITVQPLSAWPWTFGKEFPFSGQIALYKNPFPLMPLFFAKSEFVAFLTTLSIKHCL